jgi:hypothetical protein
MKTSFEMGMNRTGMGTSPLESRKMLENAEDIQVSAPLDAIGVAEMRRRAVEESGRIGSVPPPPTLKGLAKAAMKALKGERASVLVDKLGERLAFERTGARLYELVLLKTDLMPSWVGGPSKEALHDIHQEEVAHFALLQECVKELGGDPTVMTPSADVAGTLSSGVLQVLADPRTDLRQCLEGLLVAELTDNACWESLIGLARELDLEDMASRFEAALQAENRHLAMVKSWLREGVLKAAAGRMEAVAPEAPPSA